MAEFRKKLRDGLYVRGDGSDVLEGLTGQDFPFLVDAAADAWAVDELGYEQIDEDRYLTIEIKPGLWVDYSLADLLGVDVGGRAMTVAESRAA